MDTPSIRWAPDAPPGPATWGRTALLLSIRFMLRRRLRRLRAGRYTS